MAAAQLGGAGVAGVMLRNELEDTFTLSEQTEIWETGAYVVVRNAAVNGPLLRRTKKTDFDCDLNRSTQHIG